MFLKTDFHILCTDRIKGAAVMKNDENGAMFIEAAFVLPVFMIAVLSFVSFISLYIVHSKVQYAIMQTANETAVYSYFYSYFTLRDVNSKLQQVNNDNMQLTDNAVGNMINIVNTCSSALSSLSADISDIKNGNFDMSGAGGKIDGYKNDWNTITNDANAIDGYIDTVCENPKVIVSWLLGYLTNSAAENGKKDFGAYVIYPALTYKYLGYNSQEDGSKEEFLSRIGISNLNFTGSDLLPQIEGNKSLNNRVVDVVATYDYTLPFSILPKEASTFHIVQRAVSLSWGDGDDTYKYPD